MRTLLNVVWLVFGGFFFVLAYALVGLILCVLIITIPFGIASWRIAGYALWPFGRTIETRRDAGVGSAIGNVIWFVLAGFWLALAHIIHGIALCLTVIGIPIGLASFKLVPISLMPLGVRVVPVDAGVRGYPGYRGY
jgi:uncharacterized membrane protein YccF (DUF307 family)